MIDPNDQTWATVKAHATRRLEEAILVLKSPRVSHEDTQVLRGRIEELEALLELARPRQAPLTLKVPSEHLINYTE